MDSAAVYVAAAFFVVAGVLAVMVFRRQRSERFAAKNPNRVPYQVIEARVLRERGMRSAPDIEWPTASHLQRESGNVYESSGVAVRVPPYVLRHLSSPAGCALEEETPFISRHSFSEPTVRLPVCVA